MYPWARVLLRRDSDPLLIGCVTLGLSIGALSLILMWLGILGLRIDWRLATAMYAIVIVAGFVVWRTHAEPLAPDPKPRLFPATWQTLRHVALIVTGIMAALILFNAIYWPLGIDDALAIYGYYGKQIASSGALPALSHGSLYEAYPMAIPLLYAYTHQAAGWVDEHLAALIPALLSVGVIGVAYLIGRELYDRATGLIAALLVAVTPTIAYWSSTGYTDLPAAFFYGLALLFAIRHYRARAWQDALLTGIMAGLAAWMKNSGLLIVGVLMLWVGYCAWRARFELPRSLTRRDVILIAAGFLAVCGPWYARDWLLAGVIIPPTGWTFAAQRTIANLLPYLFDLRYWPTGVLFTAGLLLALWQAWKSQGRELALMALLIGYLPFFAVWWALFSYEDRFLLTLTPLIAVMGARGVRVIADRLIPPRPVQSRRLIIGLSALIVVCALPAASDAVLFKGEILHHPLMSDADKHRVRLGGRYDLALYLQTLPVSSRTLTDDTLLAYSAFPAQIITSGWPATPVALAGYDYWALKPGETLPDWFGTPTPVFQSGGYRLYALQSGS